LFCAPYCKIALAYEHVRSQDHARGLSGRTRRFQRSRRHPASRRRYYHRARATFEAAFTAIAEGAADAFLAPVENTLAGSVVRVYDLLLQSRLTIVEETILPIDHHLIGVPGATLAGLRSVASHPMALAQCERFFSSHPELKRIPAEDTAGSVREVLVAETNLPPPSRGAAPPIIIRA